LKYRIETESSGAEHVLARLNVGGEIELLEAIHADGNVG